MGTNYLAPIWRMPENTNKNKLSNYNINLNGSNEYITFPATNFLNNEQASFSFWVKPDTFPGAHNYGYFFSGAAAGNGGIAYSEGSSAGSYYPGVLYWYDGTSINLLDVVVTENVWNHIVVVFNGTSLKTYKNGSLETTKTITAPASIEYTTIGRYTPTTTHYVEGALSQMCGFNYALSDDQVTYLYNLNNPMVPGTVNLAAPIAYWPLGDNSNPTALAGYPNISVGADSVFDFATSDSISTKTLSEFGITNEFTISHWIKPSTLTNYGLVGVATSSGSWTDGTGIFYLNNKWHFFVDHWQTGDVQSTTTATTGQWYHLVGTFSTSGDVKFYINGVSENGTGIPVTGVVLDGLDNTYVISSGASMAGEQTNFQIWNKELTSSEVTTLYNNGLPLLTGAQPQETNLRGWYKLNQTANWEADTVGKWQIPDAVSSYPQSFDFDGSNDWIDCGNAFTETGTFTISAWINTSSSAAASVLYKNGVFQFGKDNWYNGGAGTAPYLSITDSNGLTKTFRNGVAASGSTVTVGTFIDLKDGNWHNITFTYNGTNQGKYYTDGVLTYTYDITDGAWAGTLASNSNSLFIGKTTAASWNGKISNVQIWNTTLPATGTDSVETLYNNGVPLTTAIATDNLKAWYKLNNNEKFDGTNWSVENQKYPANWESSYNPSVVTGMLRDDDSKTAYANQVFSMSVWVKPKSGIATNGDIFACKGSSWQGVCLQYIGNGLMFQLGDKNTTAINGDGGNWSYFNNRVVGASPTYTPYDQWSHIVVVWNGTDSKFYINGDLVSTITPPSSLTIDYSFANTISAIGARNDAGSGYFTGNVSNFAYWQSELDQTAVTALYNNGTPEVTISQSPNHWFTLKDFATGSVDQIGSLNYENTIGVVEFVDNFVSTEAGTSSGMTEQNFVNNNVSALNGESSGMDTTNLVQSNLTRTQPYSSYSINFDAADSDSFDTTKSLDGTVWSISYWIKIEESGSYAYHFENRDSTSDGLVVWGTNTNNLQLNLKINDTINSAFYTLSANDTWYNLCFTYDGSTIKTYVDGIEVNSWNVTKTLAITDTMRIGNRKLPSPVYPIDGQMNGFAVWDVTLTAADANNLYNNGINQNLSNFRISPTNYWPMDENSTYFNGTVLVIRDIISGADGTGNNVIQENIVGNAPGSDANGTGTNLTIADLKGDMKSSINNSYSINMADYADGVTNPADSGRSTNVP